MFYIKINFFPQNLVSKFNLKSKKGLIALCPHIDRMFMQNLESLALMVSETRCLDMADRQADMA